MAQHVAAVDAEAVCHRALVGVEEVFGGRPELLEDAGVLRVKLVERALGAIARNASNRLDSAVVHINRDLPIGVVGIDLLIRGEDILVELVADRWVNRADSIEDGDLVRRDIVGLIIVD